LEVRRTASSAALAIFWRMQREVHQFGTITPGYDGYENGLWDRLDRPQAVLLDCSATGTAVACPAQAVSSLLPGQLAIYGTAALFRPMLRSARWAGGELCRMTVTS
jgi:hypothetical protein